jgi:hypothetical protein
MKLGDPRAGSYIIPFLNDSDADVRKSAVIAVGLLHISDAVPKLIEVFERPRDEETARLALEALARIGDRAAERIFLYNLNHPFPERRRFAAEGLARLGDAQYVESLSRARLQEKERSVQLAQAFALYRLGRREYLEAIFQELEGGLHAQAASYLLEVEPSDLYPFLRRGSVRARRAVVEALGHIGSRDAIGHLTPLLSAEDPSLVNAANLAIRRIERRESAPPPPPSRTRPRRVTVLHLMDKCPTTSVPVASCFTDRVLGDRAMPVPPQSQSPRGPHVGCPTGRARQVSHLTSQTPPGVVLAGTHRITDSALLSIAS